MTRRRAGLSSIALIAAVLSFASCDSITQPTAEPDLQPQSGLIFNSNYYGFTPIEERLDLPLTGLKVSQLIGLNGGTITLLGHSLKVPAGAVSVPTLFTMVALPSRHVDVELQASVTDILGRVVNVGSIGFKNPVTLTLTYERATNVQDPSNLFIVYINGSRLERLPSKVDTTKKTVSTKLDHFSKYGLCSN